jgi:hypothetical protein
MIPLRSLVEVRVVVGPPALIRYNNIRAVTVLGSPAPGISSGEALKAMEQVGAKTLPAGFAGEWTDTSFQEKRAEGKTGMILGFALLFAYLFLVGLYESWTIPVPVLLSVSVGVLGSFAAMALGRLTLDLYAQIGMVVLIGLVAKNGILIVESTKRSMASINSLGPCAAERLHRTVRVHPCFAQLGPTPAAGQTNDLDHPIAFFNTTSLGSVRRKSDRHTDKGIVMFGTPRFKDLRSFYDDFSDHMRMQTTEIVEGASAGERIGKRIVSIERLRPERFVLANYQMRDIVVVDPLHRRSHRNRQFPGREGKIIDRDHVRGILGHYRGDC